MPQLTTASPRPGRLLFLVVMLVNTLAAFFGHDSGLIWDESRYLWYAKNLTEGFYAEAENPDLINGPGYPIVLMPFVALQTPLWMPRLLNAGFMALGAWFTYRAVTETRDRRWGWLTGLAVGLHPVLLRTAPYLMTEALSVACTAGFIWGWTRLCRGWSWAAFLGAGFSFGWLILTRVIFAHLLMVAFVLVALFLFLRRVEGRMLMRQMASLALALLVTLPYLAYTKELTGRNWCWSTTTGEFLYWMTSTREGESGHWFSVEDAMELPELAPHHAEVFQQYYEGTVEEREAFLMAKAAEHWEANPAGVVRNWLSNISRLMTGWPRSFVPFNWKNGLLILIQLPLVVMVFWALGRRWGRWKEVSAADWILLLLILAYCGGSSLVPGMPRHLMVILPWVAVWVAASPGGRKAS